MRGNRYLPARIAGSVLLGLLMTGAFVSVAAGASPTAVPGTKPSWATSSALVKHADPSQVVGFRLYLGWRNESQAEALAAAVSNPRSSLYGHYLTPAQFHQQFSPTNSDVTAVQQWLHASGFTVDYTPGNNHYVAAEGTVAQIEAAFSTTLNIYTVKGQQVRAPSTDLSVPASIAGLVSGAIGIDESYNFILNNTRADKNAPPTAGFENAPPLSAYYGEKVSTYDFPAGFTADPTNAGAVPWTVKGYTPQQIKGAYGISSAYDGSGETVAIIDAYASPTILSDVNTWSTNRGLPTMTNGSLTQVVAPGTFRRPQNPRQDPQGWYGEETLDVEAVHGMAPAAHIVYVGAPNNYQDLDAAMNYVVDRHIASIVTNSYGFPTELLPKGYIKPENDTFLQGVLEGIGIYFSSGDGGDETSVVGYATPDWPASSPYVTAVGGTALAVGASNNRLFETGWGTSNYNCTTTSATCTRTGWLYGAGGGTSRLFAKPSYQSALSGSGRMVPDVSALADPQTGYLVGQTQTWFYGGPNGSLAPGTTAYGEYRLGGTSLASPIFAGLMALADQAAGTPHGFANPLFYANAGAFYDVGAVDTAVARANYVNGENADNGIVYRLRTLNDYSGSPTQSTHAGWDNVTGLGTPTSSFLSTFGK